LRPVHNPMVAVEHGRGPERGEVGAGARLGVALTPDLLARQHRRQETPLLLLRAVADQHRAAHHDAEWNDARRPGQRQLLVEDVFLRQGPAGTAIFLRPVRRDPALAIENLVPADEIITVERDPIVDLVFEARRQFVAEELPHLFAECTVTGIESEIHPNPPRYFGSG